MPNPMDDPAFFDQFVLELTEAQSRLYAFIYKRLLNAEHARDVLQEANLVLWRRAREYQPGTHFMAWAYRIAHFQILALRQKQAREKLVFSEDEEISCPGCNGSKAKKLMSAGCFVNNAGSGGGCAPNASSGFS